MIKEIIFEKEYLEYLKIEIYILYIFKKSFLINDLINDYINIVWTAKIYNKMILSTEHKMRLTVLSQSENNYI